MRTKILVSLGLVLMFLSPAVAQVPELSVSPGGLNWTGNDSVKSGVHHQREFTFTNENDSKKIYNVTLEDRDWISWSDSKFNLNASESRNVSATISTDYPGLVNETMQFSYKYNDTSGNESEITFDKNFYPEADFLIRTTFRETSVITKFFDRSFTLNLSESKEFVFQLKNNGSATAYNVELGGQDISYQSNDFNLSKNDDRFISAEIEIPKPGNATEATQATNKTYTRNVEIEGSNFDSKSVNISVFVPFQEYEPEVISNETLSPVLKKFQEFCRQEGNCDELKRTVVKNRTVYRNRTPVYTANFSLQEKQALEALAKNELEDDAETRQRVDLLKQAVLNRMDQLNKTLSQKTEKAINASQEARETAREAKKADQQELSYEQRQDQKAGQLGWWALGFTAVIAFLGGIGALLKKWYDKSRDYRLIK